MVYLLISIPWVLTVAALLTIMIRRRDHEEEYDGEEEIIRVATYNEKAYWVYQNVFYEAETTREPDFSTAHPIDTESMTTKELEELMTILDELKIERE